MTTRTDAQLAEQIEGEWVMEYLGGAPETVRRDLGIHTARIAGAVVVGMAKGRKPTWNRVLGLGIEQPIDRAALSELNDFYLSTGLPSGVIQVPDEALPDDWEELAEEFGLITQSSWIKLLGRIEDLGPVGSQSELPVRPVEPADAEAWARVCVKALGSGVGVVEAMFASLIDRPGFRSFGAWSGGRVVGGGSVFIENQGAALLAAGTQAEYRNRGAQSALLDARISAARISGCTWITAEAVKPGENESNPSLNNMQRAGLKPLYERSNWVWSE
jgi:hypothetical protein